MFKCKVRQYGNVGSAASAMTIHEVDAFYVEAIVWRDLPHAVVLVNKKLQTVPLGDVTWTDWAD